MLPNLINFESIKPVPGGYCHLLVKFMYAIVLDCCTIIWILKLQNVANHRIKHKICNSKFGNVQHLCRICQLGLQFDMPVGWVPTFLTFTTTKAAKATLH